MMSLNQLFSRALREPEPSTFDPDVAEDVVAAYCHAFEFSAPEPGRVADVAELPYPKETIKQALRWRIERTSDADFRDSLKVAYVALADWQEGVGPSHQGLHAQQLPSGLLPRERAAWIATRAIEGAEWTARSNAEAERLQRELAALKL